MVTHFTTSVRENNSTKKSLGNYTSSCGSLALCECLKTFQWVDSSLASLLVYFGTWNSSAYVHSNDATPAPRKRNCVKYYMDVLFTAFLGPSNWSHFFMSLTSSLVFFFFFSTRETQPNIKEQPNCEDLMLPQQFLILGCMSSFPFSVT